jgi:hypothetical protein
MASPPDRNFISILLIRVVAAFASHYAGGNLSRRVSYHVKYLASFRRATGSVPECLLDSGRSQFAQPKEST